MAEGWRSDVHVEQTARVAWAVRTRRVDGDQRREGVAGFVDARQSGGSSLSQVVPVVHNLMQACSAVCIML
jgi:hypothetical protein